jgi:hypothetical protein
MGAPIQGYKLHDLISNDIADSRHHPALLEYTFNHARYQEAIIRRYQFMVGGRYMDVIGPYAASRPYNKRDRPALVYYREFLALHHYLYHSTDIS